MRTRILGIILAAVLAIGGAVVLTGYVTSADSRAIASTKPVSVYVVKAAIPAHTPASAIVPYLEIKKIPQVAALDGRVLDLSALQGLKTNAVIEPGEQLLTARFSTAAAIAKAEAVQLPKGTQAVTVQLPLEQAVGGTLQAGDIVGVVIADDKAHDGSDKNVPMAKEQLHKVPVLSVAPGNAIAVKGTTTAGAQVVQVTLALTVNGATDVVWGQHFGVVWLTKEASTSDGNTGKTVKGGQCDSTCRTIHP